MSLGLTSWVFVNLLGEGGLDLWTAWGAAPAGPAGRRRTPPTSPPGESRPLPLATLRLQGDNSLSRYIL